MYKKMGIIIVVLILVIISIVIIGMNRGINNMKVYFFKAGKADAILVYNNKYNILIDTGEKDFADNIIKYLNENNIDRIDYLIITHFDKDHVGGASEIIDKVDVKHVIHSNYPKDSEYYDDYIASLNKKGLDPLFPVSEMSLTLDDIDVYINPPSKIYSKDPSNNSSLIVRIIHKKNTFLFMGDAEDDRITDYLSDHKDNSLVLKVPYHGHYQDSLEELISVVRPKYSVITSSKKKQEDVDTLTVLSKYTSKYYLTRDGAVLITSDGENIDVKQ
jgi:beta-lactamase superfamily II metal-dependent hydrolase